MRSWYLALGLAGALYGALVAPTSASAAERLMLDRATATQLATLPEISPELAERIVALRAARGSLASVEELRVIPGISEPALASLREHSAWTVSVTQTQRRTFSSPAEVLAEFKHEPEVTLVQQWTSEYAKVQPELVARWLRASKAFAALPELRLQYGSGTDWTSDFRYYDEFGNPPTTLESDIEAVQTDADRGGDQDFVVTATWDLDKIVMSSEQIRVINEAQDIVKLREKVLSEATRLYFDRRRLQVDMLLSPKSDLMGQVKDELRLRELTANIDAYTGGRFSEAVAASRSPLSPPLSPPPPPPTPPAPPSDPAPAPEVPIDP